MLAGTSQEVPAWLEDIADAHSGKPARFRTAQRPAGDVARRSVRPPLPPQSSMQAPPQLAQPHAEWKPAMLDEAAVPPLVATSPALRR